MMPAFADRRDPLIVVRQPQSGCDYALRLSAGRMPGEVNDSPSDHMAAPSKTTSFSRNCPGIAESAGKPPRLGSHPGVENIKESVVRNISIARALPSADAFGDQDRRAIKMAMATSTTPSPSENCRTVKK
jgi:hypothetical protein